MKLKATIVLTFILLVIGSISAYGAVAQSEWSIGYEGEVTAETQGVNGWYFMYSGEFNKGAAFPVNTFMNCEYNNGVSAWDYWIKQNVWCPPNAGLPASIKTDGNVWFRIGNVNDETGLHIDPAGAKGQNVTPAIKWVAPAGGTYSFTATVKAGVAGEVPASERPDYDGVYISIMKNATNLYSHDVPYVFDDELNIGLLETLTINKENITMNSGDVFYFICDPKTGCWSDGSLWSITITQTSATSSSSSSSSSSSNSSTTSSNVNSSSIASSETSDIVSSDVESSEPSSIEESSEAPTPTSKVTVVSADWGYPSSAVSDSNEFSSTSNILQIILIIIAIPLIAGGVVAYVLISKKNKNKS